MNRHRYTEHRMPPRSDIRGSLERHVGATVDERAVEALARRANSQTKLIVFTPAMMRQLDGHIRAVIEGAARQFR